MEQQIELLGVDNIFFEVGDLKEAIAFYQKLGFILQLSIPKMPAALFRIGKEEPGLLVKETKGAVTPSKLWVEVHCAKEAQKRLNGVVGRMLEATTGLTFEISDPWGNRLGFADYAKRPELSRKAASQTKSGNGVAAPCISAHVIYKGGPKPQYLMLRQTGSHLKGKWQMVSGCVHEGERAWEAALREVVEDTGLIPSSLYSADAVETFYLTKEDRVVFIPVFVAFIEDKEIRLTPNEHDAMEWVSFEEANRRLFFSEQRRILAHVDSHFVQRAPDPFFLIEH